MCVGIKPETDCAHENCLKNSFFNYLQNAYSKASFHSCTKNNFQEAISISEFQSPLLSSTTLRQLSLLLSWGCMSSVSQGVVSRSHINPWATVAGGGPAVPLVLVQLWAWLDYGPDWCKLIICCRINVQLEWCACLSTVCLRECELSTPAAISQQRHTLTSVYADH